MLDYCLINNISKHLTDASIKTLYDQIDFSNWFWFPTDEFGKNLTYQESFNNDGFTGFSLITKVNADPTVNKNILYNNLN